MESKQVGGSKELLKATHDIEETSTQLSLLVDNFKKQLSDGKLDTDDVSKLTTIYRI